MADLTPFQTVGPFFSIALPFEGGGVVAGPADPGRPIVIEGQVRDGGGAPVPDALIEIWQADAEGRYRRTGEFRGFGRVATDPDGRFRFETIKPGPVGGGQAPHVVVGVLARGILTRLVTRIYFADEPATATDQVLGRVAASRRSTLIAASADGTRYRFDIRLQGEGETVFFDV